jgi:hypothetical protein
MGIRKVLGASAGSLAALLSVDFIRLVALAFLLAAPVGWFVMRAWLDLPIRLTWPGGLLPWPAAWRCWWPCLP